MNLFLAPFSFVFELLSSLGKTFPFLMDGWYVVVLIFLNYLKFLSFTYTLPLVLYWFPNINPYTFPPYAILLITDPYLQLVSRYLPKPFGIDFSFIIVTLVLNYIIYLLEIYIKTI